MITLNPRQQRVVELARDNGHVTVEALVEKLDVTSQTIRRDINYLCEKGVLSRFHGGAAYRSSISNIPYETRQDSLTEEKEAIARLVVAEIQDGSSIFLDIGTTTEAVATKLMERRGLTVITNNVNIVTRLSKKTDFKIVVCPGTLRNRDLAIVGSTTTDFIRKLKVDYSILGVVAIDEAGGILDFDIDEEELTQSVIACGRRSFAVADHSKFGRSAMAKVATVSQVSNLFTDSVPAGPWSKLFKKWNVTVARPVDRISGG